MFKNSAVKQQLLVASFISIFNYFLLPSFWQLSTRLIFAWNAGIVSWLVMIWWMMTHATPQKMRFQAKRLDASGWIILILVVASAFASLLAIVLMLQQAKGLSETLRTIHFTLSVLTIIFSWLLIHTIFAIHYAHLYYQNYNSSSQVETKALEFPQEQEPNYEDFLYFSWGIGMTCQVSDVQITSRLLRKVALLHQVLTFFLIQ